MGPDSGLFRTLLEQKEKELVSLCEHQVHLLQDQIADKGKESEDLAERLAQLQDDFQYNLGLLDDRDAELAQYDSAILSFQAAAKEQERQLQEAKARLVESQDERDQGRIRTKELENHYQRKLKEMQDQMQNLRLTKEELQAKQRLAFEATRADLMRQLMEKQEQLDNQSKEIEAQYLDQMHKQELQHQMQMDEAVNKLFTMEAQVKHLERELEVGRNREVMQLKEDLELQASVEKKEKQLQDMSMHIKRLQHDQDDLKLEHDREMKKMSNKLEKLAESHASALAQKEASNRALDLQLKALETELASNEAEKIEQITKFKERVRHMEEELVSLEAQEEGHIREFKRRQEQRLQNFKTEALNWKAEHESLLSKYSVVQKELTAALTREKMLQAEIAEKAKELQKEDFMALSKQPPLAKIRTNVSKSVSNSVVSLDTDLPAPSPLRSPYSSQGTLDHVPDFQQDQQSYAQVQGLHLENQQLQTTAQDLKEQNERLRSVVGMMRKEMEALQKAALVESSKKQLSSTMPEVTMLQEEVQNLKSQAVTIASQLKVLQEIKTDTGTGDEGMLSELQSKRTATQPHLTVKKPPIGTETTTIMALQREKAALLRQLEVAGTDVIRIAKERDQLMELSNSLRADLNRLAPFESGQAVSSHGYVGSHAANLETDTSHLVGKANEQSSDRGKNSSGANVSQSSSQPNLHKTRSDPFQKLMQLQGTSSITHERRAASEYDPLHKGTASQLSWLKSASKRREDGGKVKVRNYNIKDEEL